MRRKFHTLRVSSSEGKAFSLSRQPLHCFYHPIIAGKRAGRAAAPTRKIGGASRPSSGHPKGWPPSPRGRLFCAPPSGFRKVGRLHPLSQSFGLTAPPTRREPLAVHHPSPYRPSSGHSVATFPQGKASLRRVGTLLHRPTVHPLRLPLRAASFPSRGSLSSEVPGWFLGGKTPLCRIVPRTANRNYYDCRWRFLSDRYAVD